MFDGKATVPSLPLGSIMGPIKEEISEALYALNKSGRPSIVDVQINSSSDCKNNNRLSTEQDAKQSILKDLDQDANYLITIPDESARYQEASTLSP